MNTSSTTRENLPHILNTSANLFGICAVLITGLHFSNAYITTLIDEVLIVTSLFFFTSCLLSYLSIRVTANRPAVRLERAADYIFLTSLFMMLVSFVLLATNYL